MEKNKSRLVKLFNPDVARALAISLLLHALLLSPGLPARLDSLSQRGVSAPTNFLAASLRASGEPRAMAASAQSLPAPLPLAALRRIRQPAAQAAEPTGLAAPGKAAALVAGLATPTPASAASDVTAQFGEAGLDANGLRQFRLDLATAARGFKRYPPLARERGWSGTVAVRIAVAADGLAQSPQLLSSSGHELLDEAALDMLANATQRTVVPASLRGRSFSVPLPVVFDLDSE